MGQPVTAVFPMLGDTPCDATTRHTTMQRRPLADSTYYDIQTIPLRMRRGRSGGCVVVLRDTTAQHAATAERDALQARVQEQQRRESLSVLAGGLAHDFNNLLTGIVGNADLLSLEIPASSELGASVSAIQLGAQRAADLVAKMLAYAGERHGSPAYVDLDALVREILDLLRASAARHCHVEYTGHPAIIQADPTQIRQVAMNLLINAAEAVEEGSGQVTVTTGTEHLGSTQLQAMKFGEDAAPGEYAFLEVRDNGSGMGTETLLRIFHPFFTTKPDGHGLGLSAVQGIVLGHRGALRVDSRPGCGSGFRVWFPLASDTGAGAGGTTRTRAGLAQA
jgi:signal transduction histidine kinase